MKEGTDDALGIIVQLPLSSFWGSDDEMAGRDALADTLERLLADSGLGEFDGTDCGSQGIDLAELRRFVWKEE